MAGYDGRGAKFNIVAVEGNDLSFTVTAVDDAAAAINLGAATITATIYNAAGTALDTFTDTVGGGSSNIITLSLTDTEVDALVEPRTWALVVTRSGDARTWLAGSFVVADPSRARSGTSGTAITATVDTDVTVTVTALAGAEAANVNITDTGGYYTATTVEGALAEAASDFDAHLADTADAHDASAISILDTAGNYTATNVEAALAELPSQYTPLLSGTKSLPIKVMSSPPTVSATAGATAISGPQYFYSVYAGEVSTTFFSTTVGSTWERAGAGFPDYFYIKQTSPTTGGGSSYGRIEFIHDGDTLEIMAKGRGTKLRFFVDGELVSASTTDLPNDGAQKWLPITFSSTAMRHIVIEYDSTFYFGGVVVGTDETITPAPSVRPKALLIGDSFAEGTGTAVPTGYVPQMANHLGWDIWAAGQGGSGYSAPGSYTGKYSTRIGFYDDIDFDVIIISGGINDSNGTYIDSLAADAASLFTTVAATWPNARHIVTSPLVNKGVKGWTAEVYEGRQLLATAAAAAGFDFVDVMEMPLGSVTPVAGTLSANSLASATTISVSNRPATGSTIEIGTGTAAVERRVVASSSGGGPYTITVAALGNAHSTGDVVKVVGASMLTGTGKVGTTTGDGNCDVYVSTDGTHPSTAGHAAFGRVLANLIAGAVAP